MLKAGSAARRLTVVLEPVQSGSAYGALIAQFMAAVDHQLQAIAPVWVGHCKVLVTAGAASAYASITMADDEVRWAGALPAELRQIELTVYAAIYNLTDAAVAAVLDQQLSLLDPARHATVHG